MEKYASPAVERAMKVLEVILRAASRQVSWRQAAETLGISDRSMRRWRWREAAGEYEELFDRRHIPSPQPVLHLYRELLPAGSAIPKAHINQSLIGQARLVSERRLGRGPRSETRLVPPIHYPGPRTVKQ
jgi:hypothetical protein